jgi:two-component system sensor histidine kinase KdpD
VDIPPDMPLIWVDEVLFEQVLLNLLENAARYTQSESHIVVAAQHRASTIIIRVADDGPGLPAGQEARVFDKFFRGTATAMDGRRGVGLGLTICRAIIQAHGGQISAANRPTGGAEFVIELPCPEHSPNITTEGIAPTREGS